MAAPTAEADELAERLVSIHGEGGLSPTAEQWRSIFASAGARELQVLNLLAFHDRVETPAGEVDGITAYRRYTSRIAGPFSRAGGRVVLFANVTHAFGLDASTEWDAAVITRYPSARALAELWLEPSFIEAHRDRVDGVKRSLVTYLGI